MKKSCKYCNRIHETGEVCDKKPVYKFRYRQKYHKHERTPEDVFRSSYKWKQKRMYILKRDNYLCRVCQAEGRATAGKLSVHHIRPLKLRPDLSLDDGNLISLCTTHHEQAENGGISVNTLLYLIPPIPDK